MIKLFASDLDGTLLGLSHGVDKTVLKAIREATDAGYHVSVATGRTLRSTSDFGFDDVPIEAVCSNGSIVMDRDSQVIYHGTVDPVFLEELFRAFPQICFECVGLHGTYVMGSREQQQAGFRRDNPFKRIVMRGMRGRTKMMFLDYVFDQKPADILKHTICKINVRVPEHDLEQELHAFIDAHSDSVVDTPFDPVMFEITDKAVNKGASVAFLAKYLGYAEDEVAVYGDGGNDLVMLDRFKHSYAPMNGSDAAKAAASNIIGHHALHAVPRHIMHTVRRQQKEASYIKI